MKTWQERDRNILKHKISLLRKAKKHLDQSEPALGLCYAVGMAEMDIPKEWVWVSAEVKEYIKALLQGELWLQTWLTHKTDEKTREDFIKTKNWNRKLYCQKLFNTRIAWIDWMIEQYQQQLKEI